MGLDFLFTVAGDGPEGFLCQNTVSVLEKNSNLQRHYTTMLKDFDKNGKVDTNVRQDKCHLNASYCVTEASINISWTLEQKQKLYSDGETVKMRFLECGTDFKNKSEIKM